MELYEKIGITSELLEKIRSIILRYSKIDRAVIFGSRARGNYKKTSDIDICIYGREMNCMDINLMEDELRQLNTPLDFDVVYFENISKEALKCNIEKDGVEIYVKG
ncbi:nucleotidyltransferase family protein [Clostridium sp. ZS2-4]|uniref:nucleotidyltransferase family protein n=1 Tax=Clostridium sp. ZS2-4 TaxID=2987703 RepID=UPI00227B5928|nr:nucleotidyltransferase domain-containing protein [Clostridium sp. ZS2-4]MCY6355323.1 nucleotidyltransferase domain-containing protein [Clostridium sp. ZS2-4]